MRDQLEGIDQFELPIFNQDWWINIARGSSEYHESKVVRQNVVVGRLPFILSKSRLGIVRGHAPHWSHLGGPILDQRLDRSAQAEIAESLLRQLPPGVTFSFACDAEASYADLVRSAFKRMGFKHLIQTTYLRLPSDGDVLNTRKSKHRGHVRRAAKQLDCVEISAQEFVEFFDRNLKSRGKISNSPIHTMKCLIEEAVSRGQGRAIAAKRNLLRAGDGSPTPYDAAVVYLLDAKRCYYWLSTRRIHSAGDAKPHPDAIKLLAVKAMEDAQERNLIFDADGVTTAGTENLYRNLFGLRREQHRDLFYRATMLDRFSERYRKHLKSLVPSSTGIAIVGNLAADLILS